MNRITRYLGITFLLALGSGVPGVQAQRPASAEPQAPSRTVEAPAEVVPPLPVPRLVKFAGTLTDEQSKPRTGAVGVTFAIYREQQGGAALWVETQNVELDEQGRYTVLLGATKSEGLPLELFATGEPRWLGVQVNVAKEVEQPRVLLVSVPYALKAADAETLGGKPLSSFVLATPQSGGVVGVGTALNPATGAIGPATIGGGGNQNFVAKFDVTGANVINSSLFDNGQVGIGTTSPGALLDVQLTTGAAANALNSKITLNNSSANTGSVVSAFKMTLLDESTATNLSKQPARFQYVRDVSATGGVTAFDAVMTATSFLNASAPYPLRGINIEGPTMATGTTLDTFYGGYIGSGGGAGIVTNRFALVTEPGAGNVGLGTIAPTQKLEVAGNLKISGGGNALVFPDGSVMSSAAAGVGGGTITGVTAGTGLTGGGTTGGVALNIASGGITTALLGANSVTNANVADGSLSQTKIAGVAATLGSNSFLGNQLVIGAFHVGTGNNWFRVEGPNPGTVSPVLASWGGAGDFSIDAPGVIGGRMVVKDASGNVGIGTPTPGQKLEVAGNIKVSGAGSGLIFQDGTTQTTHQIIVPVGINDFIQQFGTPTQTKVSYGVLIPVPCWTIPQATGGTCIIATAVIPPGVTTPPTLIVDVQAAASGTAMVNVGSSGVAANAAPPSNCISFNTTQNLVFTAANTMQRFSTDVSNLAVCGATPAVNAGPGDILVFRICNTGSAGFLGFSVTSVEFVWH